MIRSLLLASTILFATAAMAAPPSNPGNPNAGGGNSNAGGGNTGTGNSGNGVGNTGPGNQGNGPNTGSGNAGGGNTNTGGGNPNAGGGNTGTGNSGNGVGNTGPGNQGNGPNPGSGNAGGSHTHPPHTHGHHPHVRPPHGHPHHGHHGGHHGGHKHAHGGKSGGKATAKQQSSNNGHRSSSAAVGQALVICGMSAAGSAMIQAGVVGKSQKRQLTIREGVTALASGCPVFLPMLLMVPEDNPATFEIARAAHAYAQSRAGFLRCEFDKEGCMTPFTFAYGDAYKHGKITVSLPH